MSCSNPKELVWVGQLSHGEQMQVVLEVCWGKVRTAGGSKLQVGECTLSELFACCVVGARCSWVSGCWHPVGQQHLSVSFQTHIHVKFFADGCFVLGGDVGVELTFVDCLTYELCLLSCRHCVAIGLFCSV